MTIFFLSISYDYPEIYYSFLTGEFATVIAICWWENSLCFLLKVSRRLNYWPQYVILSVIRPADTYFCSFSYYQGKSLLLYSLTVGSTIWLALASWRLADGMVNRGLKCASVLGQTLLCLSLPWKELFLYGCCPLSLSSRMRHLGQPNSAWISWPADIDDLIELCNPKFEIVACYWECTLLALI